MSDTYILISHICRSCGGRLLQSASDPTRVKCACCEADGEHGHAELCFCGVSTGLAKVRLRCIPNPAVSAEVPDAIVAEEVPT